MVDFRKYPYLANVNEILNREYHGISIIELVNRDILDKAKEDILLAYNGRRINFTRYSKINAILIFRFSVIFLNLLKDKKLMIKYAVAVSKGSKRFLEKEGEEELLEISKALGLNTIKRDDFFILDFIDYLKATERLRNDPNWKLVANPVINGYVLLTKGKLIRVIEEKIFERVMSYYQPMDSIEQLEKEIEDLRRALPLSSIEIPDKNIEGEIPPCIEKLRNKLIDGENLSHQARIALAVFFLNIGKSVEDVLELFKHSPDYNEKIAKYQIEHLAGLRGSKKKYMMYSCEKMKVLGLCVANCGVKNPLIYYKKHEVRKR